MEQNLSKLEDYAREELVGMLQAYGELYVINHSKHPEKVATQQAPSYGEDMIKVFEETLDQMIVTFDSVFDGGNPFEGLVKLLEALEK